MEFEYNGHLTVDERIKKVSKEIIKKYSQITEEEAKLITLLESPIIDEKTDRIEFIRLFNILFVINKNSDLFPEVLEDLKNLYKKILTKEETNNEMEDIIMTEILKYENNQRLDFPCISEIYNILGK